ncbi:MAG: RDD family protein [Planctomycetes bacterium]|nr:RDD family protein [Planctomycetota bacterium]MCC7171013.1 RDD family protein [Planctomycetota bacterium]
MVHASDERSTQSDSGATDPFAPPRVEVEHKETRPIAGPWRRWLARSIDVAWTMSALSFAIYFVLGATQSELLSKVTTPMGQQVVAVFLMPIALLLDAVLFAVFGNTLGKALLGVKVLNADGTKPAFGDFVARNVRVWIAGYGLGIPLVTLFTMVRQHGRVKAGRAASYDASSARRVEGSPIGALRVAAAIALYVAIMGALFAYTKDDLKTGPRVNRSRGNASAQTWRNEATGLTTKIEGFWTPTITKDPAGTDIIAFNEPLDQAGVVISYEDAEGFSLQEYVSAFIEATKGTFQFDGDGSAGTMSDRDGRPAWTCNGNLQAGTSPLRFELLVVQFGGRFWRTVKIQGKPTSATDPIANRLRDALWTTVE